MKCYKFSYSNYFNNFCFVLVKIKISEFYIKIEDFRKYNLKTDTKMKRVILDENLV